MSSVGLPFTWRNLPFDISALVYVQFLDLKSLVRLDSAITRRDLRATHLDTLHRVTVSQSSYYECSLNTDACFDPVLCINWMEVKQITISMVVLPDFKTVPEFAPYFQLPNLIALYVTDSTDWWSEILPLCPELTRLTLVGSSCSGFDFLREVSEYCRKLQFLTLEGKRSSSCLKDEELLLVMAACTGLKELIVFDCYFRPQTMQKLIQSSVSFLVSTEDDAILEKYQPLAPNSTCVNDRRCFLWRGVDPLVVAKYMHTDVTDFEKTHTRIHIQKMGSAADIMCILQSASLRGKLLQFKIDHCETMTAGTITTLLRLPLLEGADFVINHTIQAVEDDIWKNCNKQIVYLDVRAFTALTCGERERLAAMCLDALVYFTYRTE